MKEIGCYIHIPFCVRKCRYCDFLSFPADRSLRSRYIDSLCRELRDWDPEGKWTVSTVFLGGGTPSLLEPEELTRILEALQSHHELRTMTEVSMECNPGTLTEPLLRCCRENGVNRLSLGLQSADNRELRLLGRIHTWEEFRESFWMARGMGFTNLNVDLMSALPGQTLRDWERTLEAVTALNPEHISAYSLILEEGTPLYTEYQKEAERRARGESCGEQLSGESKQCTHGVAARSQYPGESEQCTQGAPACSQLSGESKQHTHGASVCSQHSGETWRQFMGESDQRESGVPHRTLPSEETEREMDALTVRFLAEKGYGRYEISNYAKPGYFCRHNVGYWKRKNYRGFGLGAASLVENRRFCNKADLERYLAGDFRGGEPVQLLSRPEQIEETMFLGLRMPEGVEKDAFRHSFGQEIRELYGPVLDHYKALGLMEETEKRVFLTEQGLEVSNGILADFLF